MQKKVLPFGSWPSPVTPALVLGESINLSEVSSSSATGLIWSEGRPQEGGRNALVSWDEGVVSQVIKDTKWNARTRVHEYGGASFVSVSPNEVVFASFKGPLYSVKRESVGKEWGYPSRVSPDNTIYRYADFTPHPTHPHLLLSVLEDHTIDLPSKVVNKVIILNIKTQEITTVREGNDFYSAPRWSASGKYITWIEWSHPDMPWEGSLLYSASVSPSFPASSPVLVESSILHLAGKSKGVESVSQPRWSLAEEGEEEKLVFLSDRTGFYELFVWTAGKGKDGVAQVLEKETGRDVGGPDWVFGQSTHRPLPSSPDSWVFSSGHGTISTLSLSSRKITKTIQTPFASISTVLPLSTTDVLVLGTPDETPQFLAKIDLGGKEGQFETLKKSSKEELDVDYVSKGERFSYPLTGKKGGEGYGILWLPRNKRFVGEDGEKPPCVVHIHGGPTAAASVGLSWIVQWFTSRGFAYVEVNYGGSTGYGRSYRKRLDAEWGVVDVDDTLDSITYLANQGLIDKQRVVITGGSAGGYTVLASLVKDGQEGKRIFAGGTSSYGISDLLLLAGDTHKFESQYLFNLLGGTPTEVPDVYTERSPITHASAITAPLLILQGSDDKVVPPAQATEMAEKIQKAGGKAELVIFEGEGHGFRKAENRKKAMETELEFYRKTLGIRAAEE
ncbi:alpha/beta-hydrolase [Meredithblackwellia eburnea MCA 4105]